MNPALIDALYELKTVMTGMPRQPEGTCECCKRHSIGVQFYLSAEKFNRIREALFEVHAGMNTGPVPTGDVAGGS